MTLQTTPVDVAEYLDSSEAIAAYLNSVLEDGDPAEIADAFKVAARARRLHGIGGAPGSEPSVAEAAVADKLDALRPGLNALGFKLQLAVA